jgi:hypothetical protein
VDTDSVYLRDGQEELVMWTQNEWEQDPTLVLAIVNAVATGYSQGPAAVRARGGRPAPASRIGLA